MAFPILPIVALGAGALFLMSGKKKSSGSTYEEYEPESEDLDPGGAGDTETMHFVGDVKFESAQYQGGGLSRDVKKSFFRPGGSRNNS